MGSAPDVHDAVAFLPAGRTRRGPGFGDAGSTAQAADLGLAVTAHEIRGPLLGVRAGLEALLTRLPADADGLHVLRRSVQELENLSTTVEQLLTWVAGTVSVRRRTADVVEVLDEAIASCQGEMGEERVVLHAPPRLWAQVDPLQLRAAVGNLVRNAIAYADPGTKVEVTARAEADALLLTVGNEGPIIPTAERSRIFAPFVRGNTATGAGPGSGLGLYIARRVAEEHGGQIWVESDRSGTVFSMRLPRREGERRFGS